MRRAYYRTVELRPPAVALLDSNGRLAGILALQYVLYDMLDDLERNVGDLLGFLMADSPGG
jgi:hypothetical protein